jgi:hypothetical protein
VTAGAAAADVVELERDGRPLPTTLHVPSAEPPWPLVVFAPGWMGPVVDAVTTAFLDRVLHASDAPAPAVDSSVGSLESAGVW